jgi:hypothetical protein
MTFENTFGFKKGDKVIFINTGKYDMLEEGHVYEVAMIGLTGIHVWFDQAEEGNMTFAPFEEFIPYKEAYHILLK